MSQFHSFLWLNSIPLYVYKRRPPPNWNLFIKNCAFILTCINFQSPSKYSPFDAIYLLRYFFHCLTQFWSHQFWCLLLLLPFFLLFHLFHIGKIFTLRNFFICGNNQKMLLGARLGEYGGWGTGVRTFCVKHCWRLSMVWAGVPINHPSWNGQMCCLKKNSLKLNAASHNNTSQYTDTDGFPEDAPSEGSLYYKGPALQMIIPGFLGVPLCIPHFVCILICWWTLGLFPPFSYCE